jgi:hypothetical protein
MTPDSGHKNVRDGASSLERSCALREPDGSQALQSAQTFEKLLPLGCRFDLLC